MLTAGRVATCTMVDLEGLRSARSGEEHAAMWFDRLLNPRVPCDDPVHERAVVVQGLLTEDGQHSAVPATDLVIAAEAKPARPALLHYDHATDLLAQDAGQPTAGAVPLH